MNSSKERRSAEVPVSVLSPVVRSRFSPRVRLIQNTVGVSRTKESFADECDINKIMARYQVSGILPGQDRIANARYMDVSNVDFQEAMILVASAKSAFADLPARIRDRFGNDPAQLLAFVENADNLEEARELGLARPEAKEATPLAVRVVEPAVGDPGRSLTRIEGRAGAAEPPVPQKS